MGLVVENLFVRDFRSYREFLLEPQEGLTVLVGPNGNGKTNLIEALQILSTTQSFRRPQWADVVRWGSESAQISMEAAGDGRELKIEMSVSRSGRREFKVNGKTRRRFIEVAGIIPSVVFTPEDLRLVKDSAEKRRSALDTLGSQLSPTYGQLASEYDRVVRQRNALLRDQASVEELEPWTESLVVIGAKFRESRIRLFTRLLPYLEEAHENVSGIAAGARYVSSHERDGLNQEAGTPEEEIRAHLKAKEREERTRLTTVAGPHRDEIEFTLEGRDARAFASQGQQRTIALAWKLAEVSVIQEVSGQTPLLLLDDVMSELDEQRRHALASVVGKVAQTIMTTTNIGYFDKGLIARASVVSLS